MLAHLQKLLPVLLVSSACLWLFYFQSTSLVLAIAGFLAIACAYAAFLAIEFMLMIVVGSGDSTQQPLCKELLSAWVGESLIAPQVFCWWQPFRSNVFPDYFSSPASIQGHRGVVFVHGLFCNRGFWTPWLRRLQSGKNAFIALNLEPVFGSIDDYVSQIDNAVQQITDATGVKPLLVCHSMGGLAARAWLTHMKAEVRVHHVVTIATPHRGTWLARFAHGHNGRQMRLLSDWQGQLDYEMPADRHKQFTCWYSNCDNIVFPTSNATLPGAENRLVRGAAHVQLAFLPQVMDTTLALLDDTLP